MVSQIYPIEPQLNKANTFDTEALFSNLDLSITNGIVFELVNFSFLDLVFLASLPMVYTFRNLFILREFVLMLVTSTKKPFFFILIMFIP